MIRGISRKFFLLVMFALPGLVCAASSYGEERFAIGFPEIPKGMNILSSEHPAAQFLRNGLTNVLAETAPGPRGASPDVKLGIADSMRVSYDRKGWSFRISSTARFSNDRPLRGGDVLFSVNRCRRTSSFSVVEKVEVERDAALAQWVKFNLRSSTTEVITSFLEDLSNCPLIEEDSSRLFGEEVGEGANLVGAGHFMIKEYKSGKQYLLSRIYGDGEERQGAGTLEFRGFNDAKQALTALRSGTLDGFLTSDTSVLQTATTDATLTTMSCGAYTAVLRKGLHFGCGRDFSVVDIRFVS